MHVFFDSEFTQLSTRAKLISVGFVTQDGREFYGELHEGWSLDDCSDFVHREVIPHLGSVKTMSLLELRSCLKEWLESLAECVEILTDSPEWDWPWISFIFPEERDWPCNLARQPVRYFIDEVALQKEKRFRQFRAHHALDDARLMYRVWRRVDWK
jgi:hypothetical protein